MKKWLLIVFSLIALSALGSPDTTNPFTGAVIPSHGYHQKNPWSVGTGMSGTVTNVTAVAGQIQFKFTGWFWFSQYPEGGTNGEQIIKVNCLRGISATVTPDSFVAETTDWRGASVQNDKNRLLEILNTAAKRAAPIKMELLSPMINFGGNGFNFTLMNAKVWRITDADLH